MRTAALRPHRYKRYQTLHPTPPTLHVDRYTRYTRDTRYTRHKRYIPLPQDRQGSERDIASHVTHPPALHRPSAPLQTSRSLHPLHQGIEAMSTRAMMVDKVQDETSGRKSLNRDSQLETTSL